MEQTLLAAAGTPEAARLTELFCALATIPSPTGSERACSDAVETELRELGLTVERDGCGPSIGGDCDNLYCRIPPTTSGLPLFLCAHLDTVPVTEELRPVVIDGVIRNEVASIIGADNKAAIAVVLDLARTICDEQLPHAGIELVFTVGEEQGLLGSSAFDVSTLTATTGFVFDHPGQIGGYVDAAPSRFVVRATMHGRASHSGISPELGINAIVTLARAVAAFPESTAAVSVNVAQLNGGGSLNVVPDRASVGVDIRSLDHAEALDVARTIEALLGSFAQEAGCTLQLDIDNPYLAYRLPDDSGALQLAKSACARLGLPAYSLHTRGGSDANAFRAAGLDCVNLAHAVVDFHGPDEHVAVSDLVLMERVALAVIAEACDGGPA